MANEVNDRYWIGTQGWDDDLHQWTACGDGTWVDELPVLTEADAREAWDSYVSAWVTEGAEGDYRLAVEDERGKIVQSIDIKPAASGWIGWREG